MTRHARAAQGIMPGLSRGAGCPCGVNHDLTGLGQQAVLCGAVLVVLSEKLDRMDR